MNLIKASIFTLAVLFISSCATYPLVPQDQLIIQKVIESQKDKTTIYQNSMDWISKNFRSSKAVIDYQDKEAGKIIGKGVMDVEYRKGVPVQTNFTFTIEIKDNKIRFTIENPFAEFSNAYGKQSVLINNEMNFTNRFKPQAELLIRNYEKFIGQNESNW